MSRDFFEFFMYGHFFISYEVINYLVIQEKYFFLSIIPENRDFAIAQQLSISQVKTPAKLLKDKSQYCLKY